MGGEEPREIEDKEEGDAEGVDFEAIEPGIMAKQIEERGLGGRMAEETVIGVGEKVDEDREREVDLGPEKDGEERAGAEFGDEEEEEDGGDDGGVFAPESDLG